MYEFEFTVTEDGLDTDGYIVPWCQTMNHLIWWDQDKLEPRVFRAFNDNPERFKGILSVDPLVVNWRQMIEPFTAHAGGWRGESLFKICR